MGWICAEVRNPRIFIALEICIWVFDTKDFEFKFHESDALSDTLSGKANLCLAIVQSHLGREELEGLQFRAYSNFGPTIHVSLLQVRNTDYVLGYLGVLDVAEDGVDLWGAREGGLHPDSAVASILLA